MHQTIQIGKTYCDVEFSTFNDEFHILSHHVVKITSPDWPRNHKTAGTSQTQLFTPLVQ